MKKLDSSRRTFLKTSAVVATTAIVAETHSQAQASEKPVAEPLYAYVGTFSSPLQDVLDTQVDLPPGNGRGIHIFKVNRDTGALTQTGIHRMGTSPSCLAVNHTRDRLYSVNETDQFGKNKTGTVSSFSISEDGNLKQLNSVSSGGAGPTYVSIHPSRRYLLIANYFGGSIAVIPIKPDGSLKNPSDVKIDDGKIGPTKATHAPKGSFAISGHDRTHAHMIESDPTGRFVLHVDLGLDKIFIWKFDQNKGTLQPNDTPSISLPPGDGPRHFHFHPNKKWFYSIQEEGSTVVLFDWNSGDGSLKPRQTISTLPKGFAGSNFCSEILVSADGKFLYAGNRLHDSIAVYSIEKNGTLKYLKEYWTQGNYPRSFSFDPTGRYLYCCNQRSDNVAIFSVDLKTGGLTFTGQFVPVGNPSHVAFADMDKRPNE